MLPLYKKDKNYGVEVIALCATIIFATIFFIYGGNKSLFLLIAAMLGLYMAINIGANDIANNMGPAVGSKAITITGAIIIAAIFEASGVMIAGGDVVETISKGIINPSLISDSTQFIVIMMATLAGAAIWVNIATALKAPVSTTHSIVGGLIGAGVTAIGINIVDWSQVLAIALSWIVSPIMGGVISVILTLSIRKNILKQDQRGDAAKIRVPIYIGIMVWAFSTYLLLKGLKPLFSSNTDTISWVIMNKPVVSFFIGYVLAVITFVGLRIYYKKQSAFFKNSKSFINKLFNIPLIFAVALLSFAHGANDVANAIGPLAAINDAIRTHGIVGGKVGVELWIMVIGAIGLVLGLSVYGARLIKTVGSEITKLNQIRAYCVALSAALTVIIASALGLPVSSTHIALGGVFGIGLLREYMKRNKGKNKEYIHKSMILNIGLAWIITLPASGIISAIAYLIIYKIS